MTFKKLMATLEASRCEHHIAYDIICVDCRKDIAASVRGVAEFAKRREEFHATFNGGHHDDATRRAFHHGMDTVFNALDAASGEGDKVADEQNVVEHWSQSRMEAYAALMRSEDARDKEAIPPSDLTITVNGRECVLQTGFVDYVDIARLSEFNHRTPNLIVTWWVGDRSGTLLPTPIDSVMLEDGMAFSVRLP